MIFFPGVFQKFNFYIWGMLNNTIIWIQNTKYYKLSSTRYLPRGMEHHPFSITSPQNWGQGGSQCCSRVEIILINTANPRMAKEESSEMLRPATRPGAIRGDPVVHNPCTDSLTQMRNVKNEKAILPSYTSTSASPNTWIKYHQQEVNNTGKTSNADSKYISCDSIPMELPWFVKSVC